MSLPQEDLTATLDTHLLTTEQQMHYNKFTLEFHDQLTEENYIEYSKQKFIRNFTLIGTLGILFMGIFQTALYILLNNASGKTDAELHEQLILELITIPTVYIPLLLIVLVGYLMPVLVTNNIHVISFTYVLFVGPIFMISKALTGTDSFYGFVTAPFYISVMYLFVYFFRLCFVYCLWFITIAVPVWFTIATISWYDTREKVPAGEALFDAVFIWSGVSVLIACIVLGTIAYTIEVNSRLQFLSGYKLLILNSKLVNQLKGFEDTFSTTIADLDSPLEKAILSVKLMLASPVLSCQQIRILHSILQFLNSSHLHAPDLYQQVKNGDVIMDKEEQNWLFNELARGQKDTRALEDSASTNSAESFSSPMVLSPMSLDEETDYSSVGSNTKISTNVTHLLTVNTLELLDRINEYNFPIFEFAESTSLRPLVVMSHELVIKSGLLDRLGLNPEKFMNFMISVESGYRSNLTCNFKLISSQFSSRYRCFTWNQLFMPIRSNQRCILGFRNVVYLYGCIDPRLRPSGS
jgi:hypothetical protein